MSAATIAALRAMMHDEIKHGMYVMEHSFNNQLHPNIGDMEKELKLGRSASATSRTCLTLRTKFLKKD